ncbi:MAG: hypothetical protein ACREEL_14440 [Stellaceae bacterium]
MDGDQNGPKQINFRGTWSEKLQLRATAAIDPANGMLDTKPIKHRQYDETRRAAASRRAIWLVPHPAVQRDADEGRRQPDHDFNEAHADGLSHCGSPPMARFSKDISQILRKN